ncbi:MAG: SIR2 family protein [Candidatus Zixiibacteriota bacterium]
MAINKRIITSPIILFLGAGASVPLGKPTMKEFVTKLEQLIPRYNKRSQIFHKIAAFRNKDLEEILGDLEKLHSLQYINSFNIRSLGLTTDDKSYEDLLIEIDNTEVDALISIIKHEIIKEYRELEEKSVLQVYEPLFETIFSSIGPRKHFLPVFTTNYDLAVEEFCRLKMQDYGLTNGIEADHFSKEFFWNPSIFQSLSLIEGRRQIVLFKLHGSVDWIRLRTSGKIVKSPSMYDRLDSKVYQNVIIYPTGDKIAIDEPFVTNYRYLTKCCEKAKLMIVIGYSFRDYGTINALVNAFDLNRGFYMILISPHAEDVLQSIPHEFTFNFVNPIPSCFGEASNENEYLDSIKKWISSRIQMVYKE